MYLTIEKLEEKKEFIKIESTKNKYYYYKFKLGEIKTIYHSFGCYYINNNDDYLIEKANKIIKDANSGDEIIALVQPTKEKNEIVDLELVKQERIRELALVPGNIEIDEEKVNKVMQSLSKEIENTSNYSSFQMSSSNKIIDDYYTSFLLWILYLIEMKMKEDLIIDFLKQKYYEIVKEIEKVYEDKPKVEEDEYTR